MCLFKHHIKKGKVGSTHHEEIWGVRIYSSTHYQPWQQMDVSGHPHDQANLFPE